MYHLNIVLNCNTNSFVLSYKDKESAYAAAAEIDSLMEGEKIISLEDHYGHRASIERRHVAATLVIDLEEEYEIQVQKKHMESRASSRLQRMVANDPSMRLVAGVQ